MIIINAEVLKNKLTNNQIFKLLEDFGAEPKQRGNKFECLTVCHGGDSHKLIYYFNTKNFMCYTSCGYFDVIELVQKIKDITFNKAINFLINKFNLEDNSGFNYISINYPVDNPLNDIAINNELIELPLYDETILNNAFYDNYYQGWIDEGISITTMKKYEIKYNLLENQIVIPHRDYHGNLVGIRVRNLNEDLAQKEKYKPITYSSITYKYPVGLNLYGLHLNKDIINKFHKVILFEAEKSVMKMDSYFDNNYSLCLSGSNLTDNQINLLNTLDIEEVIIGLDKEFQKDMTLESKLYAEKIYSKFSKLKSRYNVSVLWDSDNLLDFKDSPIDKGKTVFDELMKNRIFI